MNQKVTMLIHILVGLFMIVSGAKKFSNFKSQQDPTDIPEQMRIFMGIFIN